MVDNEIDRGTRLAGAVLAGAAVGTVFAMMHHPSDAHSELLGGIVHGAMIFLLCLMTFGFAFFSLALGARRPFVLAAMIAYGVGLFGHIGAATINGFVVPALAARAHGAVDPDIFLLAWEMNQALARLGVVAAGGAYALWSIDLIGRGRTARWLGAVGLLAGLVPAALLVSGAIRMNLLGALLAYSVQAAWAVLAGFWLWRGKFSAAA